MSHHQNPRCWTCGHDCYSYGQRQVTPAQATTCCKNCGLMKNYYGPLPYRCKCDPVEQPNSFPLALCQSNNSIQRSMVAPRNGVMTRYYNNIEQGVQTYQRAVVRNGVTVETEEYRFSNN